MIYNMKNLYMSENFNEAWERLNEGLAADVGETGGYLFKTLENKYGRWSGPDDKEYRTSDALFSKMKQEASKKFWAAAKQNQIDIKNFWIAFVLNKYGRALFYGKYAYDVFNDEGLFKNKSIYGDIKKRLDRDQQD